MNVDTTVMSRRAFMRAAAGTAAAVTSARTLNGWPALADSDPSAHDMLLPRDRVALQLYTVRNELSQGQTATEAMLDKIADYGFKGLEMASNTGGFEDADFAAEVAARQLHLVGDHRSPGNMRGAAREPEIERAATLGLANLGCGGFGAAANVDGYKAAAEEMNEFGQALTAEIPGCRWYVHLHDAEWALINDSNNSGDPSYNGRRLIEIWFEELDPAYAFVQVDICWAWRAIGAETPDYVATYQDAIPYFHVKDLSPGGSDVDYPDGVVDFEAIYDVLRRPAQHEFIAERDGSTNYDQTLLVFSGHLRTVRLDRSVIGAPANASPPELAGTPAEGAELTVADDGEWVRADGATYTYRWFRGEHPITGETGPAYLLTPADVGHQVAVEVTAATTAGETVELSPALEVGPRGVFKLGAPKADRRRGTAKLPADLPAPGDVDLKGAGLRPDSASAEAADRVTLDVRPKGGLLRRLRRRGRAPVRARVTYDPLTGESESAVKRITLRLRRKR